MDRANGLRGGSIGVAHIVFFVIATAGPLVSLVGAAPPAIALGNGIGLPSLYLLVSGLYVLFSFGFTAMSRHVNNAGAFFAYIAEGFGMRWGVAGAMIAIVAYTAVQIATYALFGIFVSQAIREIGGPGLSWWCYALAVLVAIGAIGERTILFSGRILGLLLILEIVVILGLDAAIVLDGAPISVAPFNPSNVFVAGFGAGLAFVVPSFLGFEATAIFGEEAQSPERTIPIATYISILVIGGLYAVSSWMVISAYPLDTIVAIASGHMSTLVFDVADRLMGKGYVAAINILMITSMFAALLSLHNTLARYFFSLGRSAILPSILARTHERHQSPYVGGRVQSAMAAAILLLLVLLGADAYTMIFPWFAALAAVSILVVQFVASMAVYAFFRRSGRRWDGRTALAPLLAALGLGACAIVTLVNLPLITGSTSIALMCLPMIVIMAGVIGHFAGRKHQQDGRPDVLC